MLVDTLIQKHNAGLAAQLKVYAALWFQKLALETRGECRSSCPDHYRQPAGITSQIRLLTFRVTPVEAAVPGADAQRLSERGVEVRTDKPWPRGVRDGLVHSGQSWNVCCQQGRVHLGIWDDSWLGDFMLPGFGTRSGSSLVVAVGTNCVKV